MHILSILFFAVSSSSDNFAVGLSYGIKNIRLNPLNNFIIGLISGAGTFFAMLLGRGFSNLLSENVANIIGCAILVIFGLYMLVESLRKRKNTAEEINTNVNKASFQYCENALKNPEIIDADGSKNIEFKEALTLGIILCMNNIGLGIGASIAGLSIYLTPIFSMIFSMVFLQMGCDIGRRWLYNKLSQYSDIVSALIIIVLGVYELFF